MPAIYLGRIATAGARPISPAVAAGSSGRPAWSGGHAAGWSGNPLWRLVTALPAEARANRVPLLALGVLVLSLVGLVTAVVGAGG